MKKELTKQYVNEVLKSLTPTLQLAKIKELVDGAFKTKNFYELDYELSKYQGASSLGQKQRLAELKALVAEEHELIISNDDIPVDDGSEPLKVGDIVELGELVGIDGENVEGGILITDVNEDEITGEAIKSEAELDVEVELEDAEEKAEEKEAEEVEKPKKKRKSKKDTETLGDLLDEFDGE